MKKILPFILLLICFFIVPVNAESVDIPDSQGYDKFVVVNERFGVSDISEIGATSIVGINRISTEEDTFYLSSDDTFNELNFEISVDVDSGNETIPFSIGKGDKEEEFYLQVNNSDSIGSLLTEVNLSLYSGNGVYLASDKGLALFYEYFQVCINRNGIGVNNQDVDYGLMPIFEFPSYVSLLPADRIKINIADSNAEILCRMHVYDNAEYAEEDDESFIMGIYWLIESIIGDSDNVLYAYFQVADLYFNWVTGIIVLMVTAPFMYVFFALVCGLVSCILKGSFTGGVSAGISTFIKVMKIPVHIFKMVGSFIYGIIKILKPVG